jgi:pilus assembly protein CpaB
MQSFRSNTTVMIALAVVFGGAAVFLAKTWLAHQADLNAAMHTSEPASATTLVVAAEPLRFGMPLTSSSLREISWPSDSLPAGAYAKIDQFLSEGNRVVIQAMEPYEPVLKNKVTGPGQRAGLASLVTEGQRAVTIRVNDVNGVAGFILPNDRVDVVLSRHEGNANNSAADVVLQNVRVLAIDQVADDQKTEPSIVKAVTIETNMTGAQKVSLASLVGTLSLTLRHAGDVASLQTKRITLGDLSRPEEPPAVVPFMTSAPVPTNQDMTVRVMRATEQKDYIVPREK